MMPALRGLQQRDCSGISPDSLLSLEDSETLLEGEESALSTKPPQRYDNFRIYQSVDLPFLRKNESSTSWGAVSTRPFAAWREAICGGDFLPIAVDWVLLHWSWRQLSELTVV